MYQVTSEHRLKEKSEQNASRIMRQLTKTAVRGNAH